MQKVNKKSLLTSMILALAAFIFVLHFGYKVDYDNLGGGHVWLSGSTIVFVNNWLEEGAVNLGFTNYELPASIEFETLEERSAYVSYPTGTTAFVFLAAKLLGKTRIDVSFLKTFQVSCYAIEAVLFCVFTYFFLSQTSKLKESVKGFVSVSLAAMWVLLPLHGWYLANVYFADQCVILWVMAFLLTEYLQKLEMKKKCKAALSVLKVFIIYTGMLIDYYFWILVFVAFIVRTLSAILQKKKLRSILKQGANYVVPVFAGGITFLLQLVRIPNWFETIKEKFLFRTGMTGEEDLWSMMKTNLLIAFGQSSKLIFCCLIVFLATAVVIIAYYALKKYKIRKLLTDNNVEILLIGMISPILQIALLFNHSSVHIFSMIKLGWIIVALILAASLVLWKLIMETYGQRLNKKEHKLFMICYLGICCIAALILGIPHYTLERTEEHYKEASYGLEEIIYQNTDYYDVCYSFTEKIPINPPMSLSVAEKRIYLVETINEIINENSKLPSTARILLVVDKESEELSAEQAELIEKLEIEQKVRYADDRYCLIELTNIPDISVVKGKNNSQ